MPNWVVQTLKVSIMVLLTSLLNSVLFSARVVKNKFKVNMRGTGTEVRCVGGGLGEGKSCIKCLQFGTDSYIRLVIGTNRWS